MLDPPGELRASVLQRSHQMDIPHDDRRLRSEALEQRLLPFVEGVDLGSVYRKASNDLAVEQHRRRHRAADATLLLHVTAHELGVGEHVGDLLDPAFYSRPSDHRATVHLHREVGHVADELLRQTDGGRQPEGATLDQVDRGDLGTGRAAERFQRRCRAPHRGRRSTGRVR